MQTTQMQPVEKDVWAMIEPGVDDLGLRVVRVRLTGGERPTLQIMIEPKGSSAADRLSVSIDECQKVSRMVSALMDVNDPIESAYHLEVSSTGLERPLVTEEDFIDYVGANVKVVTLAMVNGSRKFKGKLLALKDGDVQLQAEGQDDVVATPMDNIKNAELYYTDAEFKAMMAGNE